jgi:ATP-dependent RNA helicase DHX8/PRP22
MSSVVKTVIQIILFEEKGDILVFLTGQEEIEEVKLMLTEKLNKIDLSKLGVGNGEGGQDRVMSIQGHDASMDKEYIIFSLYANLPASKQMQAFAQYPGQIKVVLATNIAETSVTIPGTKYVVDSGLQKLKTYVTSTGVDSLKICPISQFQATQRAGRAGRETSGGKCFRLYTQSSFNSLAINTLPEMLRCNLSGVILSLKAIGIKDVFKMEFVDKPSQQSFLSAFDILIKLGAVNPQTGDLTTEGLNMSTLPTEPIFSKLLVHSLKPEYRMIRRDVCTIVAMLSVENIYLNPLTLLQNEREVV